MRRIGVQLQDIGTRLCWQVFVDDPGENLGLAEMVDLVATPDVSSIKSPDHVPYQPVITKKITVPFTFKPWTQAANNTAVYTWTGSQPVSGGTVEIANHSNTSNPDEQDEQIYIEQSVVFDPPQPGYHCNGGVRLINAGAGGTVVTLRGNGFLQSDKNPNECKIVLDRVRFNNGADIPMDLEVDFVPIDATTEQDRINKLNAIADAKYDADKARLLKRSYLEAIRQRIKDVNQIRSRPTWDLREEERTIIYRKLIEKLMLGAWKIDRSLATEHETQRIAHLRAEVIRTLFDVDALLYFVAPEWWKPRVYSQLSTTVNLGGLDSDLPASLKPTQVAAEDRVSWTDDPRTTRKGNYKITEDSNPARLGSSLGWLLQLDGDNLRNAFLNSPWVKAVLPIRPGREVKQCFGVDKVLVDWAGFGFVKGNLLRLYKDDYVFIDMLPRDK